MLMKHLLTGHDSVVVKKPLKPYQLSFMVIPQFSFCVPQILAIFAGGLVVPKHCACSLTDSFVHGNGRFMMLYIKMFKLLC